MTDEPTDQDLTTDHPFEPSPWPDTCGHPEPDGWFCGRPPAEHAPGDYPLVTRPHDWPHDQ